MSFLLRALSGNYKNQSFDDAIRDFIAGNETNIGGEINVYGENSLRLTAAFGCMRVLAETFCSAPIKEYKKAKNGDRIETDDTGLLDKLKYMPNEDQSAMQFHEMGVYQMNLGGNFVALKQASRSGRIANLTPVPWQNVQIELTDSGRVGYKFKGSQEYVLKPNVFHVPGPSFNGYSGMSPIEYAASAIKLGMTYEKFSLNFYKNGAMPSGSFEHPTELSEVAFTRLREQLKEKYQDVVNAGTPILLEDGTKFTPLAIKLIDAELLASKIFQIQDICRLFRVQPHLVQELSRSTNNNIEHQSLEFVMYTMLPWFKRWESAINTQLLTAEARRAGYYFEYNMSGLLRGDMKSMAEAFAIGRQWGWLSVNDIRPLLNLNAIETGTINFNPLNMTEAGKDPQESVKKEVDKIARMIEEAKLHA